MSPQKLAQSWDQIVIGAGSSAINFLYSAFKGMEKNFLQKRTLVIGRTDLWTPMDPDHNMGQPGKLLRGVEGWKKVGEERMVKGYIRSSSIFPPEETSNLSKISKTRCNSNGTTPV